MRPTTTGPVEFVHDGLLRITNVHKASEMYCRVLRTARTIFPACTLAFAAVDLLGATPALAIPSPELVVGSLTSISQLVALASALIGGGAVAISANGSSQAAKSVRRLRQVALALGLLMLASFTLNAWQYQSSENARRLRLEASLLRPTPKATGGATLDPLLREIPYSEQLKHPQGVTTAEAEEIVKGVIDGSKPDWMILDIRETAETEMGSFPSAVKVRFPDLPSANIDFNGRTPLLICHNGNRSAETCAALKAKGQDCRFIKGGLEKWLVEGRHLQGLAARTVDELRTIPSYPNQRTLLDTPEVKAMVDTEGAYFLDVRYPGEFAAAHLPGAVNLPLRSTPTQTIKDELAKLPKKPVIAPCYDRRSCFFGEIVGLELTRAGLDFRGRYTVPWEYFLPAKRPPHVEAVLAQSSRSTWTKAGDWLTARVTDSARQFGLVATLALLALLSRLLILPFALKAERDQIVARRVKPELDDLKKRLADDPLRQARAMRAVMRDNGLTPARNLIALLFLPVLALSVEAVTAAAKAVQQPFLWVPDLSGQDATFALPVVFAALLALYVHLVVAASRLQRFACWLGLAPALAVAGALLPAAADLYVIVSASLLLCQRALVTGALSRMAAALFDRRRSIFRRSLGVPGLVSIDEPDRLAGAGNKALRLAQLRRAGLSVPDGVVLTEPFLAKFEAAPPDWQSRQLDRVWRHLRARSLAVRSSAAAEDGTHQSFAGVFESLLDVKRSELPSAVAQVLQSFRADRVASYAAAGGARNILVQPLVAAEYSGVLFSEDPSAPGLVLIEAVSGLGDRLVSGRASPEVVRYGRASRKPLARSRLAIDFAPLVDMALAAERLFGASQDIEWAYARGRFVILQSRDITTPSVLPAPQAAEWRRLAAIAAAAPADGIVLARNEMSEMLPLPTQLSLSLTEALWQPGGSVDLALRSLGIAYPAGEHAAPLYQTAFARLYVDKRQQASRAPRLDALALRRIRRAAAEIERTYREEQLPRLQRELQLLEAVDLTCLTWSELTALLTEQRSSFVNRTHAETDVVNIAAQIFLDDARRAIEAAGLDPLTLLADIPETEVQKSVAAALKLDGQKRLFALARAIGHRSRLDYELAEPRYGEDSQQLLSAALAFTFAAKPGQARRAPRTAVPPKLARTVTVARAFQALKEDAKHHSLRELAMIRRIVRAIGTRSRLGDLVFHLTIDELIAARPAGVDRLAQLAMQRAAERADLSRQRPLPPRLDVASLERGPMVVGAHHGAAANDDALKGTRVSGSDIVEGRAVVVDAATAEAGLPVTRLAAGDILVAPMIHPAWLPEIVRAGGAVAEIGGWLSHMSIVAREHGTAMIVAVPDIAAIPDGAWIRLHADGRIELLARQPVITHAIAAAE